MMYLLCVSVSLVAHKPCSCTHTVKHNEVPKLFIHTSLSLASELREIVVFEFAVYDKTVIVLFGFATWDKAQLQFFVIQTQWNSFLILDVQVYGNSLHSILYDMCCFCFLFR